MNYISVIKGLENTSAELGTKWLQGIVDSVTIETAGREAD